MINEYTINEIFSTETDKTIPLVVTLDHMSKYTNEIKLLYDSKFNLYYQVEKKSLLDSEAEMENLFELSQGGWKLSENNEFLILYI